jgi:hypothetical protein
VALEAGSGEKLVLSIGLDDSLTLEQLSRLEGETRDASGLAADAFRTGLAALLATTGLERHPAAEASRSAWPRLRSRRELRAAAWAALAVFAFVALVGGYGYRWGWTGFADNNQLWDWLELLLLPIALGTFPLWLRYGHHMGRPRQVSFLAAVVAFAAFVAVGYLMPLEWTGFRGNTLWDWLTLLLLPLVLSTFRVWPSTAREVRPGHITVGSLLALALLVTLIGGYAGSWAWTGYPGNTLWDWIQLVLGPVVLAVYVIPAVVRWVSGDVERTAAEAEAAARERRGH